MAIAPAAFSLVLLEMRTKAPGAKTFPQAVRSRFGNVAHILTTCMFLITSFVNVFVIIVVVWTSFFANQTYWITSADVPPDNSSLGLVIASVVNFTTSMVFSTSLGLGLVALCSAYGEAVSQTYGTKEYPVNDSRRFLPWQLVFWPPDLAPNGSSGL
nr:unnamed protein product [Spirometra erinaceieuropaei]